MTNYLLFISVIIPLAFAAAGGQNRVEMNDYNYVLVDFTDPAAQSWRVINDAVMGGVSRSRMTTVDDGTGVFEGEVSLENNGGFASARMALGETDLSGFDGLAVRVAGDGKRYRLRLRTDSRFDGIAYQARFETNQAGWEIIEMPFDSFVPTYRGRTPSDAPPLDVAKIYQIGIMVADKQEGSFRLEISWVSAYKVYSPDDTERAP